MNTYPADFWNERFDREEYLYGTEPNQFIEQELDKLETSTVLFAAEGEGRNAVYAAQQGWEVSAFDFSKKGKKKALQLAEKHQVEIDYQVADVLNFKPEKQFDVMVFCYSHFPSEIRKQGNLHLLQFLKPGGKVIFEAFAKSQLGKPSGGPKNKEMLFSVEEVQEEFYPIKFVHLKEEIIQLSEGEHHVGEASVIRMTGIKK